MKLYLVLTATILVQTVFSSVISEVNSCFEYKDALECVADSECGWCGAAYSCMEVDAIGRLVDDDLYCTDLCTDSTSCSSVIDSYPTAEWPPLAWQMQCKNGGMYDWTKTDNKGRSVGGSSCDCPAGWGGNDCSLCKSDDVCGENSNCNKGMVPERNHWKSFSCVCDSDLCISQGFGPGLGSVDIVMHHEDDGTSVATINILKSVIYPPNNGNLVTSPYLIKAAALGCTLSYNEKCSKACTGYDGSNMCFGEKGVAADAKCAVWDCSNDGLGPAETAVCQDEANTQNANLCKSVVKNMLYPPYQFVCSIEEQEGHTHCSFKTKMLPHGTLGLECYTGGCGTPNVTDFAVSGAADDISWCQTNEENCIKLQYVAILGTPVVLVAVLIGSFICVSYRAQRASLNSEKLADSEALTVLMSPDDEDCTGAAGHLAIGDKEGYASITVTTPSNQKKSRFHLLSPKKIFHASNFKLTTSSLDTRFAGDGGSRPRKFSDVRSNPARSTSSTNTDCSEDRDKTYLSFNEIRYGFYQRSSLVSSAKAVATSCCGSSSGRLLHDDRKGYRQILRGVTGYIGPELMAILGPSGSGKTSFIDIIAGRKNQGVIEGTVEINGKVTTSAERRKRCGYVMQDDVFPGTTTVREYLLFHANLRLPSHVSLKERNARVNDIINELGLTKSKDSQIGDQFKKGLSGGEKRRVSIGVELLANSELLVLDEPTSGLDSASTKAVVDALSVVVRSGKGVVMSIHQPSSTLFHQFDRILLLSGRGQVIYCGPQTSLVQHFDAQGLKLPPGFNPAEFLLDIVSELPIPKVDALAEAFYASKIQKQEREMLESILQLNQSTAQLELVEQDGACCSRCWSSSLGYRGLDKASGGFVNTSPPFLKQFRYLAERFLNNVARHPMLAVVNFGATTAIGVVAGSLYTGITNDLPGAINRAGLYFFILAYLMLSALADLGVWQEERIIFMRERASGCYGPLAFLCAKFCCETLPLRLAPTAIFVGLTTFMIGLNDAPHSVFIMLVVLLLVNLISAVLFLVIGMLTNSSGIANFLCVLFSLYCLLMTGFLLQFDDNDPNPLAALQYLSFLHFAYEALMVNEMNNLIFEISVKTPGGGDIGGVIPPQSGDMILLQLSLDPDNADFDLKMLLVFLVVYLVIAYMLLNFRVKERR